MLQMHIQTLNINKLQKAGIKSSTLRELIITVLKLILQSISQSEKWLFQIMSSFWY
jgi:hypothetical protein